MRPSEPRVPGPLDFDVVMMNKAISLIVLLCSGCCTAVHSPRELKFENGYAWFHGEDNRPMRVETFEPMVSKAAEKWFPEETLLNFTYSWDPVHFELHATLAITSSGRYELISGEDEVVLFLGSRMKSVSSKTDIQDFLEMFAEMRGYTIIEKEPETIDRRVREGKKVRTQDYTMIIQQDNVSWKILVSLQTNWMSGAIHRYEIRLPKENGGRISIDRGNLHYFADYIR